MKTFSKFIKISSIDKIPQLPGVYAFFNKKKKVIYIGKAINLSQRVKFYFQTSGKLDAKTTNMTKEAYYLSFIPVEEEFEALLLAAKLIKDKKPKYNSKWKDDKSFLYILITNEEYPRVLAARKGGASKGTYFGPFPKAATVRKVLKFLRQIFPFCSQKISKKPCFYSHLALCNPCPSKIVKLPKEKQKKLKNKYLKNIRHLKNVLEGRKNKVVKDLEREMKEASRKEEFEKAKIIRDRIEKLKYITSSRDQISSYLENPNFLKDQRLTEVSELEKLLMPYFGKLRLKRVECFDISSLSGKKATGSMIVFLDGIQEKESYRHFRIRKEGKPNDIAMIKEIVKRRLKHQEWPFPSLIVVDGGKGQVSGILSVLEKLKLSIPVIGLAKRLEEIIIPKNKGFEILKLPPNSPALNFLKRARDEAHRFAISYHKRLSRKLLLAPEKKH